MGKIGANKLLPKALKGCPKYKKSPNLVTLQTGDQLHNDTSAAYLC